MTYTIANKIKTSQKHISSPEQKLTKNHSETSIDQIHINTSKVGLVLTQITFSRLRRK